MAQGFNQPPGTPEGPGGPPGYPQQGYQQQPMQPGPPPESGGANPPKPGCLMPGLWLGISTLVTLGGLAFLGISASGSETAGVQATWIVAGPLGIVWAGSLTAFAIHLFYKRAAKGVRAGVPLGCGCLGGIILFSLVFVFFAAIWPSL